MKIASTPTPTMTRSLFRFLFIAFAALAAVAAAAEADPCLKEDYAEANCAPRRRTRASRAALPRHHSQPCCAAAPTPTTH